MRKTKARKVMIIMVALILTLSLILSGCGTSEPTSSNNTPSEKEYKIVLILPGPINDQGWNATAYAGLQLVEQNLGVEMEYVENVKDADFETTFRDYGEKGYDLVFGHGVQFLDAAKKVAPKYPDTFYMIINSEEGQEPNLGGIGIREWEGGYVAGTMAGLATESKKLGAIGSFPYPVIQGTIDAFEMGAKAVDPSIEVAKSYVNSWDDIQKGKETSQAMIENGADVVFCSANQVGLGSIAAAQAEGVKAVGYIAPQNDVAPETVIGSVTYNTPKLFEYAVQQLLDGTLEAKGYSQGWKEGVMDVQWSDQITPEMKDTINAAIQDLKDGKIQAPATN